jgi:hypothetical protein
MAAKMTNISDTLTLYDGTKMNQKIVSFVCELKLICQWSVVTTHLTISWGLRAKPMVATDTGATQLSPLHQNTGPGLTPEGVRT